MQSRRNTPDWIYPLLCISLVFLLTACKSLDGNNKSADINTSTAVDNNTGNNSAENSGTPPTDSSTTGSTVGGSSSSDDTASTESPPIVIALSWQATPGQIDGYIVHTGPTPEAATSVLTVTPATTVEYDALHDLGLNLGDQACFRIKAYNSEGQSGFSDAVCYAVNS